jgi:integrase
VGRPESPVVERYLSDDERAALFAACRASDARWLFPLAQMVVGSGARLGELLGLSWSDVDRDANIGGTGGGSAHLADTTNGKPRDLFIPLESVATLREYRKVRRLDSMLVFPPEKKRQGQINIRPAWNAALKASGVEAFRFHDLRHSAGSYLAQAGYPTHIIQEALGHASAKTTFRGARYLILSRFLRTPNVTAARQASDNP